MYHKHILETLGLPYDEKLSEHFAKMAWYAEKRIEESESEPSEDEQDEVDDNSIREDEMAEEREDDEVKSQEQSIALKDEEQSESETIRASEGPFASSPEKDGSL